MNYNKDSFNKLFNEFIHSGLHQNLSSQFTKTSLDVNVIKLDDAYIYEFAIPGVSKKDISIKLEERHLHISLNEVDHSEEGIKKLKTEYSYEKASRKIPVPQNTDTSSIKAAYKNGILSISLSIMKEVETKKNTIEIK